MQFRLHTPCSGCPFRSDSHATIPACYAEQIAHDLLGDGWFLCTETLRLVEGAEDGHPEFSPDVEHCAGAMILLEKAGLPDRPMRLIQRLVRLGLVTGVGYDPAQLDMAAPVFNSLEDFVEHFRAAEQRSPPPPSLPDEPGTPPGKG